MDKLIEDLEINFVGVENFNRKWLQASKVKLGAWYIENLKRVIRKKRALEERYKINLPFPQLNFDNVRTFIELQEAIGKIEGEELNIVDYALNEFQSYLTASERRYKEFKNAKEKKRVLSHAQHRFTRSYQKKLKIALTPLFLNRRWDSRSVFLTLTLDPKKWTNRYEMWTHIKEEENRFLTGLFKKLGKRIPYISVVEAHKGKRSRGNPHLHFLFLGVSRLMDWREIRNLWGLGHIWINHTTEGKKIKRPVAYMFKYITKAFGKTDEVNKITQALIWLFHVRSYSTSRGLVKPLNEIGPGEIGEYEMEGMLYIKKLTWDLECNLWEVTERLKNGAESDHDPG